MKKFLKGITLAEIAVTVGILAFVSAMLVVIINPAELLRQARDSARISHMGDLKKAIELFEVDSPIDPGEEKTVYISIPDPAANPGSRTNCSGLGDLPALPTGWKYSCVHEDFSSKTDGTGWVPFNFASIASGAPLSKLPLDPVNTAASGYYYTYTAGGSYVLTARLESEKQLRQTAQEDTGSDPLRFEAGSDITLWAYASGLLAYWKFNDGIGNALTDSSGRNHTGTLFGTPSWVDGKQGKALTFSENGQYVQVAGSDQLFSGNAFTIAGWVHRRLFYRSPTLPTLAVFSDYVESYTPSAEYSFELAPDGSGATFHSNNGGRNQSVDFDYVFPTGWVFVALTWEQGTTDNLKLYVDGKLAGTASFPHIPLPTPNFFVFGRRSGGTNPFTGSLDEFRLYSRALSASEIAGLHAVFK